MSNNLTKGKKEVDIVLCPACEAEFDIKEKTAIEPAKQEKFIPYNVTLTIKALNVRKGPSRSSEIIKILTNDSKNVRITEETFDDRKKKWGKIQDSSGWIDLEFVKRV